ncbi:MAG: carbon-nitrogen hydrolase family protein [Pseudomonadota bacterium]
MTDLSIEHGILRAACVQNCATPQWEDNLRDVARLIDAAHSDGAMLVALPEYFSGLETDGARIKPVAFAEATHPVLAALVETARDRSLWLLLGSLGIKDADGRVFNRSYLISPDGRVAARYDKIHMFDVDLGEGKSYRESETIAPGATAMVADTPWGGLGLSICYDLRFPALYREMARAGADILAIPAAFTRTSGEAHWHTLVRARAIETGSFVLAPCQFGTLDGGAECFGHSLIVDPWGEVLGDGGTDAGYVIADLNVAKVAKTRTRLPSLLHDRAFTLGVVSRAQAAE